MKKRVWAIPIVGMLCIFGLAMYSLSLGINGQVTMSAAALIGLIAGGGAVKGREIIRRLVVDSPPTDDRGGERSGERTD